VVYQDSQPFKAAKSVAPRKSSATLTNVFVCHRHHISYEMMDEGLIIDKIEVDGQRVYGLNHDPAFALLGKLR
jgi:hypothetical protein